MVLDQTHWYEYSFSAVELFTKFPSTYSGWGLPIYLALLSFASIPKLVLTMISSVISTEAYTFPKALRDKFLLSFALANTATGLKLFPKLAPLLPAKFPIIS